ncbi:dihydroorotate dehydrogenase B (NAD(+)), electron transfer subunit [Clostridia bacterium]|nr:dihydroorotate dehydrogenase B (NAD(+)), electron transfer subunit [Clostridia bacterium]
MRYFETQIIQNVRLQDDIWLMKIEVPERPKAGQFYTLRVDGELLPRPLSVCETENDTVTFAYQIVGSGTKKLSNMQASDTLWITGALGNGFNLDVIKPFRRIALVSGGIGIAPLIELAKHLEEHDVSSFCGFSDCAYLLDKLPNSHSKIGGFVTDLFDAADFDLIIACGPDGFTRVIVQKCRNITPLLISLDKHMACGIGACLVCSCKTADGMKRCCADGPIFWGEELSFD